MTKHSKSVFISLAIIALLAVMLPQMPVSAATSELFISEYGEGSGYNKYIEIYNGTGAAIDLSDYQVWRVSNGGIWPEATIDLEGILADGQVLVVYNPGTSTTPVDSIIATAGDLQLGTGTLSHNGDDAIGLVKNGILIDAVGEDGPDPGSGWDVAGETNATADHVIVRKGTVCDPSTDWTASRGTNTNDSEWIVLANEDWSNIGTHTVNCNGTGPEPGQPLPLTENFDDCTLAGWEVISVDTDTANTWSCNATYSNIEANGYGDNAAANEWLITPPLNLNAQEDDTLTFRSYTNYTDIDYPQLEVLYSTDYDAGGDPTSATWTALSGVTFSPEASDSWTDSGNVDLSGVNGTNVYIAFHYQSSGTSGGSASTWRLDAINIFEQLPPTGWVINEIHADPASNLPGDANGDGTRDYAEDEFVEVVNNTGIDMDISGWTLSDDDEPGVTFPDGTILPDQCAVVVFGGGIPTGAFGDALVFTDDGSIGSGLGNSGDVVIFSEGSTIQATASYGSEGGDNQSLTLNPDITGLGICKAQRCA